MLILALALMPAYYFPEDVATTYRAKMSFDGFLPILGVGEGKAEVNGTFQLTGKPGFAASITLTAFDVSFNGGKIPIDLDDAQKYVPSGSFKYTSLGVVSDWNPPTTTAAIRIPGMDLKHLPEVIFLPLVFPANGCNIGQSFTFTRPLSGGIAEYTVTLEESSEFKFKVHQAYSDFEDDANQVVPEKDAALKVTTDVVGTGTGSFGDKIGRFISFHVDDVSTSTAIDLQTKKSTIRKLSRHLEVTS